MPVTPHPWCLPKPVAQQRVRSEFKLSKEPQVASPPFEPENSHMFLHSCCLEGTRVIFLCIWICVCESIITHHWLIFRLSQAFIANPWNKQVYLYFTFFFFFGLEICGILFPWPGIKPVPPALEGEILTTGSPEKSSRVYQLLKRLAFPVLKVQSSGKDIHHVRYQDTAFINHSFVFSRNCLICPF